VCLPSYTHTHAHVAWQSLCVFLFVCLSLSLAHIHIHGHTNLSAAGRRLGEVKAVLHAADGCALDRRHCAGRPAHEVPQRTPLSGSAYSRTAGIGNISHGAQRRHILCHRERERERGGTHRQSQ
jgi:hypothetical protein